MKFTGCHLLHLLLLFVASAVQSSVGSRSIYDFPQQLPTDGVTEEHVSLLRALFGTSVQYNDAASDNEKWIKITDIPWVRKLPDWTELNDVSVRDTPQAIQEIIVAIAERFGDRIADDTSNFRLRKVLGRELLKLYIVDNRCFDKFMIECNVSPEIAIAMKRALLRRVLVKLGMKAIWNILRPLLLTNSHGHGLSDNFVPIDLKTTPTLTSYFSEKPERFFRLFPNVNIEVARFFMSLPLKWRHFRYLAIFGFSEEIKQVLVELLSNQPESYFNDVSIKTRVSYSLVLIPNLGKVFTDPSHLKILVRCCVVSIANLPTTGKNDGYAAPASKSLIVIKNAIDGDITGGGLDNKAVVFAVTVDDWTRNAAKIREIVKKYPKANLALSLSESETALLNSRGKLLKSSFKTKLSEFKQDFGRAFEFVILPESANQAVKMAFGKQKIQVIDAGTEINNELSDFESLFTKAENRQSLGNVIIVDTDAVSSEQIGRLLHIILDSHLLTGPT